MAATREDSFYLIARGRGTREACELIGVNYSGTIVREGWAPYRVFTKAKSQTCVAHLLRRLDDLLEVYPRAARCANLAAQSESSAPTGDLDSRSARQPEIGPHGLMVAIGHVEAAIDRLLDHAPGQELVQRLVLHLRRERKALFTFLHQDATPATNYLAEQALRPAVVNCKMPGGNNTPAGAQSSAVLMTVMHSARKRGVNRLSIAADALRNPADVVHLLSDR